MDKKDEAMNEAAEEYANSLSEGLPDDMKTLFATVNQVSKQHWKAGALWAIENLMKEYFMEFLGQGCGQYNRNKDRMEYDHMCLSTYEDGIQFALERGWITKDQVVR